jgi:hypothetical protein
MRKRPAPDKMASILRDFQADLDSGLNVNHASDRKTERTRIAPRSSGKEDSHASPAEDLRADGEWWLSDLARELDIPQPTLRGWVRRGWLYTRQLSGAQGRWLVWADQDELNRLERLRAFSRSRADQPFPKEMTTPKERNGKPE